MREITYITITEKDDAALWDLAAPIWRECYADVLVPEQIEFLLHKYFDAENLAAYRADGMCYEFMMVGGVRAGFLAYKQFSEYLYLDKIYLLPAYRGLHLSSAAFDRLLRLYKKPIRLNVNRNNKLGLRSYKGNGFQILKEERYDLPGGFVNLDYIMEKPYTPCADTNG